MVNFDQFRETFFEECDDCLAALEVQLMDFQAGRISDEGIEEAFRAIHSIKGGAGAFGFARIIAFSHEFETVLDRVRNQQISLNDELNATLLRAFDILTDLIADERSGEVSAQGLELAVLDELKQIAGSTVSGDDGSGETSESDAASSEPADTGGVRLYRIVFRPSPTMMQRGNEPLLLIRELGSLGTLHVETDLSALPALDDIDPMTSYLGWTLHLQADCGQEEVEEIFEFVEGDCELDIRRLDDSDAAAVEPVADAPEPGEKPEDRSTDQATKTRAGTGSFSSIRVDLERIDRMVNMVGEIVIAQAAILQQVDEPLNQSHPQLVESLQQFMRHTQNLRDSVMAIRAQPVKSIFDRMPRLVRELTQQTGKKVRLETVGEETEIDKTVIEKLSDPLTHMIRNAVDHGIEMPERRMAAGKTETGLLRLSAQQRGSHIVIDLSDDGRGLDREAIRAKAVERGLISADQQLGEQETDNLIFKPGFSTVEAVSDLSGRGVGMDVVNENIRKLGGRAAIRSQDGAGTTVTLILPLTLAVMEGMVVRIGPTCFIIPLTSIIESMALHDRTTSVLPNHGEVIQFRSEYLKVYDLRNLFGFGDRDEHQMPLLMVIETESGEAVGLRVDEIIGQQQVVVKKLEDDVSASVCVAGGSIMGNGEVALILDVTGLRELEAARWKGPDGPDGAPARRCGNRRCLMTAAGHRPGPDRLRECYTAVYSFDTSSA